MCQWEHYLCNMYIVLYGLDCGSLFPWLWTLQTVGLETVCSPWNWFWYCRYSGSYLYCNEWLLVLTSRDMNHPISWHLCCDVILGETLNWNFVVLRYTSRIVFCQVFRICKLKSIYTVDKLYWWTARSLLGVNIIGYWVRIFFRFNRPFIICQDLLWISVVSSRVQLREKYRKGFSRDSCRQLFRNKGMKWTTWLWSYWTLYEQSSVHSWLTDCLQNIVCSFTIFFYLRHAVRYKREIWCYVICWLYTFIWIYYIQKIVLE